MGFSHPLDAGSRKEMLRTSIPTVFQRNIVIFLLNAVRIRRDNKDGVLHITKLDIRYNQVHTFMNIVYRMHIHVMYMYGMFNVYSMYVQCMYGTFGFIP